jgi:hypothetical protein
MSKVVQYLINNSPPGQVSHVQNEIVTLLGSKVSESINSTFTSARRTYDLAQGTIYSTPSGSLVCCPEGSSTAGVVVSSVNSGEVYKIDHVTGILDPMNDNELLLRLFPASCESTLEPYRQALYEIFSKHTSSCYCPHRVGAAQGKGGVEVFYEFNQEGTEVIGFVIVLSALVTNLRNFWAGQLKSRLSIQFPSKEVGILSSSGVGKEGTAILTGKVAIRSHYSENGNVQMFQSRELKSSGLGKSAPLVIDLSKCESPQLFASQIQKLVAGLESSILVGLDDSYDGFSAHALKEVRRILPVSGTKFNWLQLSSARVMKSLAASKK